MAESKVETSMTTTYTVHVDDETAERLERFRDQQAFEPSKSQVIRAALEEYLDAHLNGSEPAES